MNRRWCFVIIALVIAGCQHNPENPIIPVEGSTVARALAKGGVPTGFVVNEQGYRASLIADGLTGPEGFGIMGSGVIYVVDNGKATIEKILPSGNATTFVQIPVTIQPFALTDLAVEPSRGMFVSVLYDGKIFNVRFSGLVTEYASGLNMPTTLALDSHGDLYVCEIWDNCVTKVDRSGIPTTVIQLDELTRPRGLAFDDLGRLYVLSSAGTTTGIRRFDLQAQTSFPMTTGEGILIATIPTIPAEDQVQDIAFGFGANLFAVGRYNIYRVTPGGSATIFATGLGGNFNRLAFNTKGDMIVSDYAQNQQSAARLIRVSRLDGR
jgi:hypothetical protein